MIEPTNLVLLLYFFFLSQLQSLPSILGDDRFKVMFENPEFQVDEQSEEFRLLNPLVSKVGQKRKKKLRLLAEQAAAQQVTPIYAVAAVPGLMSTPFQAF